MITEQAVRGKGCDIIERVISIIIMDDVLIPEDADYYNEYGMPNRKTGTVFSDLLTIAVPEQPDGRGIWSWGRFFRSRSGEELKMAVKADTGAGIGQAMAVLMEPSEDERARRTADARGAYPARFVPCLPAHGGLRFGGDRQNGSILREAMRSALIVISVTFLIRSP
ncbi:MAG: Rpn family recombination-promoting nuclease/putative transposase [Treponema sp.]|jgi:hypothetical protein|nr:Rpn family recombination-promoting nuclease/putative transposase [Treponema sp.]